ncbi:MAG: hypothetical protein AB2693_30500 [Candidatus Thiodiazotropha sp.]
MRDPDPVHLAPLRDGDLNCVAKRVVEHFEGALRGRASLPQGSGKYMEAQAHDTGETVIDVKKKKKIIKRAIVLLASKSI